MVQLESQIQETKRALYFMYDQRRQLKSEINRVHDPIAHRVPPEIASNIFGFCIPDERSTSKGILSLSKKEFATPLRLGAVCQYWRRIVWSTPQLWTFIQINLVASDMQASYDIVRQWLARSGRLPLLIHIDTPKRSPGHLSVIRSDVASGFPLIELINLHCDRWRQLSLSIPSTFFSLFCRESSSLSMLHTLRLECCSGSRGRFNIQNMKPGPEFISLTDFRVKAINVEWDNVREVELKTCQLQDCFELLKQATRLTHCTFHGVWHDEPGSSLLPVNYVLHPQLKVLSISCRDKILDPFFSKVTFPSLDVLSFDNYIGRDPSPIGSLISFFDRSNSRLTELHITEVDAKDDLVSLLEALPSLLKLEIVRKYGNYSPDDLLKCLAETSITSGSHENGTKMPFLPELEVFRYWTGSAFSFELIPGIFGPLSELHNPRRRPLNVLHIHLDHDMEDPNTYIDEEILPSILDIVEAGLNLKIVCRDSPKPDLIKASMEYHDMI
ncbi:hypothetical protein GALMADRAFT_235025 [Galerina marginata CBS 339.88]|uniref:Uncharacterized protein n=1 Tax=Galerina marginata (strain CBS 339.88) TaxID=685588 RepID=A0A067U3A1_GALM3|nr:hypothetical protein GALMADRAFT_235025 [Galerina marginata CBS 339.88]